MDRQMVDFWKESILREDMLRRKWFRVHGSVKTEIKQMPGVSEKEKIKLPKIKDHQPKHAAGLATRVPPQIKKNKELVVMRPPSENTRKVLYDGVSKEEKGHYKYLLLRKQKKPEEKYPYPLTSNWLYGWGLEPTSKANMPKYGLVNTMMDTFFLQNGTFPPTQTSSPNWPPSHRGRYT